MYLKQIFWVGSFSTVFLFLPSLGLKLWERLALTPWQYSRWLVYPLLALMVVVAIRKRFSRRNLQQEISESGSLLNIAKQRLVKGEITLEEFRQIRQELKHD